MFEAKALVIVPKPNKDRTGYVIDMCPLVLCEDCKWYQKIGSERPERRCAILHVDTGLGWFCADGEKRTDVKGE